MSADEDTELRDLVAQTLETNGTLGKLRAQLRASVFLALEDQENGQSKSPFLNKDLRGFLSTKEGQLTASLVQEFLQFFNLDFTLAVFKPETGLIDNESRTALMKDLNLNAPATPNNQPLLASLVKCQSQPLVNGEAAGGGDHSFIAADLSEKQVEDARKKFEYYDKDKSGAIDKDEMRELFLDMFPHFNHNMLERYVNDEFKATDKNFSSSIDFEEFLGMYKRLFLLCRTVVAGDVSDIVSPTHHANKSQLTKPTPFPPPADSQQTGSTNTTTTTTAAATRPPTDGTDRLGGSDVEEDPFFNDVPASTVNFSTLSNFITERSRSSFLSELEKNKESQQADTKDTDKSKGKSSGSAMSSLDGLPSLTSGRGSSVTSSVARNKSPVDDANDSDVDKNLREIDKRMKDFGVDSQNDDFEYEDDFSPEHSLSQKNSKSANKPENGSIAEEIDDEEIDEDISIEADDLLNSEKSGFDDLTTDHSVSQADGGFDYMEEPVQP